MSFESEVRKRGCRTIRRTSEWTLALHDHIRDCFAAHRASTFTRLGTVLFCGSSVSATGRTNLTEAYMNGLIYLIGLIVVIMAILSFFGLR